LVLVSKLSTAARRLLLEPGLIATSGPWQLSSPERLKTLQSNAPGDARRRFLD
jgi:hypothetical protein